MDRRALIDAVRGLVPEATSAVLVGSAARRREVPPADFDVMAFGVPAATGSIWHGHLSGQRLDVVAGDLEQLLGPLPDDVAALSRVREIRKFAAGILLFDDTRSLVAAQEECLQRPIPKAALRGSIAAVLARSAAVSADAAGRLDFLHGVENLVFGWLHLDIRYPYAKPKWIYFDVAAVPRAQPLHRLVGLVSAEAGDHTALRASAHALGRWIAAANKPLPLLDPSHLRDAHSLLDHDHARAAVWPLRMAAYQAAGAFASIRHVPYHDLRNILDVIAAATQADGQLVDELTSVLLLQSRVPPDLEEAWMDAREAFLVAASAMFEGS